MRIQEFPGRPVHVRVAGDHVVVVFEQIPWPLRVDNVSIAIQAFSSNDWAFFQNLWWQKHQHLKEPSAKLARLIPHMVNSELYSPSRVISLGCFLGTYGPWDLDQMEKDFQKLSILPCQNDWSKEGMGTVHVEGEPASPGWPGSMWQRALENQQTVNELSSSDLSHHIPSLENHSVRSSYRQ